MTITKGMGPQKTTSKKKMSIWVVLGQNALITTQNREIFPNQDYQNHGSSKIRFQFGEFGGEMHFAYYTPTT